MSHCLTVEIKVTQKLFMLVELVDGRILIRTNNYGTDPGGPKSSHILNKTQKKCSKTLKTYMKDGKKD